MQAAQAPVPDRHPLTAGQFGLLYESELSAKPALNLLQIVTRFEGEALDPARMARAWSIVTARHDALRLSFHPVDPDGPMQRFHPQLEPDLRVEDRRLQAEPDSEAEIAGWIEADRRRGVPLQAAPCWRVSIRLLAEDRAVMLWTFHHAMLDGGGYRLILRELFAAYDGRALPPPGPGFAAHAEAVAALDHSPARAFFREHLGGFDQPNRLDPLFLPATGSEGAAQNGPQIDPQSRRALSARLDPDRAEALRRRAARVGATTATLLSAAWAILLGRISGRDEAVFGVTRSGRHLLAAGDDLAGCQINTLPLRARLRGTSLDGLLAQLRGFTLDTRAFEHTPLTAIAEVSDLPGGTPLFDTLVMFDRGSLPEQMRGLGPEFATRSIEEQSQMATPLSLSAYDDPALLVRLDYDPARVSEAGAARIFDYLLRLLDALPEAGDVPLGALPMLPPDEEALLRQRALPSGAALEDVRCVVDRFEDRVRQQPGRIAVDVMGPDKGLTYAELDARANHLARCLRDFGIGPGDVVGLALPRGVDFVAALLAVLKTQAAFLPLDPAFPAATLDDMIARAGTRALLTCAPEAARLQTGTLPLLLLDDPQLDGHSTSPPRRVPSDPESPAYIIYTSGSTGTPKGVVLPQRAFAHHAAAAIRAFGLTPDDRVLQFASLNFDVSIEEIIPTLLSGARLILRDDEAAQSVPHLLAGMAEHRITVANLPTAFWHILLADLADAPQPVPLPESLRLMIVGGERVSGEALARWRALYPGLRWLNGYGPTETAITATLYDAEAPAYDGGEVPIGQPLGHARTAVMAADGSLAPLGMAGELWIGGPALALGYLGLPDQSAEVFVDDPLQPGVRAYRSGDKVSWRPDGVLAYHGRLDRQIKLRGFRIELSAIEAALEADPVVLLAAVALDRAGSDQARLIAWVRFAESGDAAAALALAERLCDRLPAFMVPQIVPVDTFPRKPSGKIDMGLLPRPQAQAVPGMVPADPCTARVQAIFASLLGHDSVGPDESFFDLGGHSLLSVRLMSLLQRDFGRRLPLATLFQIPTPRQIAAELALGEADEVPNCLVPIQPLGDLPPLYAIHILGEQGAFFRPLGALLVPEQPLIGLTLDLLEDAAPTTLPEIAAIYRQNIDRHRPNGPVQLIAVSQGAYIAFELAQQLIAAGREVSMIFMLDAEGPGGRPRRARKKNARYYLRRVTLGLPDLIRHRVGLLRAETLFQLERLRLSLERRGWTQAMGLGRNPGNVAAHQAAIDLAISAYQAHEYPGDITVFRASDEQYDTPEGIASALGWAPVAPGRVRLIETGGTHLSMLHEPHVRELVAHLRPLLLRSGRKARR